MRTDRHAKVSVAPMMGRTDRHERRFLRQMSPSVLLYSEMITTGALLHGDAGRFLRFDAFEKPVALQLGGSEPDALARCAEMAARRGYDEINLNVGCPSDRVRSARFGVCLMNEPALVAAGVRAMSAAVDIPVTVKTRIGVDDNDSWEHFRGFVETVAEGGCGTFIVHARKAWLKGLSPRENREIPPLRHDTVHRLKSEFPELEVVINGGIVDVAGVKAHLRHVDGVMIGRAAYENPWLLARIEAEIFGGRPPPSRHAALDGYLSYVDRELVAGVPLPALTRHTLGLFRGLRGARAWRRMVGEDARSPNADSGLVRRAAALVEE